MRFRAASFLLGSLTSSEPRTSPAPGSEAWASDPPWLWLQVGEVCSHGTFRAFQESRLPSLLGSGLCRRLQDAGAQRKKEWEAGEPLLRWPKATSCSPNARCPLRFAAAICRAPSTSIVVLSAPQSGVSSWIRD